MKKLIAACIIASLFSCQKEKTEPSQNKQPEICRFQLDPKPFRVYQGESFNSKKRYGLKLSRPTIYLDFDGQLVSNTAWIAGGIIDASNSGFTLSEQQAILDSVALDYAQFNVLVTTNEADYYNAPLNKRTRVIITQSYEWYGAVAGISYVGSFTWGTETPAFVFSSLLGFSTKKVAEVCSHEAGHTLFCNHQSVCVGGVRQDEYNSGDEEHAPIMGISNNKRGDWWIGTNQWCEPQDDVDIITATLNM